MSEDFLSDAAAHLGHLNSIAQAASGKSEWQPIETAPQDGTSILLGWVNSGVSEGQWRSGAASYWKLPGFYFTDDDPLIAKPCKPTHWMPLPAPPEQL